ncbi:MAG TPA: hypothetical protein VIV12_00045 [Streptosporangiaceae bacterium]
MNPRTRRAALYAIGAIAIAASANALAHSYAGLYEWAVHHRLSGWQAKSWPAEIDVFLAVGELALYVAYLDGWPARRRIWPWATALIGLAVSVAGNIGHIQPMPGHPVLLADRLTAATSPLAAFAGLTVGLLVLRMNRQPAIAADQAGAEAEQMLPLPHRTNSENGYRANGAARLVTGGLPSTQPPAPNGGSNGRAYASISTRRDTALLRDAADICKTAATRGEHLSQRMLARALRTRGHRFPNQDLHQIALAIGLDHAPARSTAQFR